MFVEVNRESYAPSPLLPSPPSSMMTSSVLEAPQEVPMIRVRSARTLLVITMLSAGTVVFGQAVLGKVPSHRRYVNKQQVLLAIPVDGASLVNIGTRLFPATPDITLLGRRATSALSRGLLGNTASGVRWRCAQVLTQLRDARARVALHKAVKDWNAQVRGQVIRALGEVGDSGSAPLVLGRLKDPHETVAYRRVALRTLGRLGDSRAVPAVVKSFRTAPKKQPLVRLAALRALWDLRSVVPAEVLEDSILRGLGDKDRRVARQAVVAAGHLKLSSALPGMARILAGNDEKLRNITAFVLGRIGDRKAVPILVKAMGTVRTGRLLNNISFALQRLGDPKLWPRLRTLLKHDQAFIRLNASFTAGDMGLKKAVPTLIKLLDDSSDLVRNQSVAALAKIGDPRAIAAILPLTRHHQWRVRWLPILAVVHLAQGKKHRELMLKELNASGPRARTRVRLAALALAAFADKRAGPPLLAEVLRGRGYAVRHAVRQLKSPVLTRQIGLALKYQLGRGAAGSVGTYLSLLRPALTRGVADQLLRHAYVKWYARRQLVRRRWRRNRNRYRRVLRQQQRVRRQKARQVQVAHWGRKWVGSGLVRVLEHLAVSGKKDLGLWIEPFTRHRNYKVRTEASVALAALGDEQVLASLVAELKAASDHHRPYLVRLLGRLPRQRLAAYLSATLTDADPFLAMAAAATMLRAGDSAGLKQLILRLAQPQASVRERGLVYLRASMSKAARGLMRKALSKEKFDPAVRTAITQLLKQVGPSFKAAIQAVSRGPVRYSGPFKAFRRMEVLLH